MSPLRITFLTLASALALPAQDLISFEPDANGYLPDGTLAADDSSGTLLATMESPTVIRHNQAGSLDSKPWIWSFDFSGQNGAEISAITMENIGLTNGPVGFNNLAASSPSLDVESAPATVATPEVSFSILAVSFALLGVGQRGRANA